MEVRVIDGDLEYAIRRLKKFVGIDGVLTSIKFRELFPNVTDRKKDKARRADRRREKKNRRVAAAIGRSEANEKAPSWKFVHRNGEYVRVPVAHKEMRQV